MRRRVPADARGERMSARIVSQRTHDVGDGVRDVVVPGTAREREPARARQGARWVVEAHFARKGGDRVVRVTLAGAGDRLTTRGRLGRLFTRKGREYADLDVLVVADGARPILHVRHTAIYRLPEPGPA